jgi:hypothetical protein
MAGGGAGVAAGVEHVVIDALRDQNKVGEAEVDGQRDDGRDEAGPGGADEVGDIAKEPDQ